MFAVPPCLPPPCMPRCFPPPCLQAQPSPPCEAAVCVLGGDCARAATKQGRERRCSQDSLPRHRFHARLPYGPVRPASRLRQSTRISKRRTAGAGAPGRGRQKQNERLPHGSGVVRAAARVLRGQRQHSRRAHDDHRERVRFHVGANRLLGLPFANARADERAGLLHATREPLASRPRGARAGIAPRGPIEGSPV